ncbi:unnamed protein product [Cyprideis torosa]|uniref:protein-tyrosine-phosphatase n=1 Tax=Cyprideis torosa TaxID=163714 RepID=A0A7R8WY93_9CRUS|nr:unnamed protein product [Cyprideis torosa]CAG0908457.1 unnamed protein product [Cyprideis torosa]
MGYGLVDFYETRMPVWAPPPPSPDAYPTEVTSTSESISIRFRKNSFSNRNGEIVAFAIIVAEDFGVPTLLDLPRYQDVQRYSSWPPYQANEPYFPFASNNSFVDFTIGTESCEGKTHYCNGPLKPGTAYRIKVRAFTSREKYADTSWSPPIETLPSGSGAYVGAVVGSLLILLVVVVLFLMRRYHVGPCRGPLRAKPRHSGPHHGHHHHHHSKGTVGDDSLSLPDSVIVTNR